MKKYLIAILMSLLLSCSSARKINQTGVERIDFGYGGGFTGKEYVYSLKKNGSVYFENKKLAKIPDNKLIGYFAVAQKYLNYSYNNSHNIYFFVEFVHRDKKNRIFWTTNDQNIDKEIIVLYNNLNNHIQSP